MFRSLARLSTLRELKLRCYGFDEESLIKELNKPSPLLICRALEKFSLQFHVDTKFEFKGKLFCQIFSKIFPKLAELTLVRVPQANSQAKVEPYLYLSKNLRTHNIKYGTN